MGVLNVTPDSFSDAGEHFDRNRAVEHALHILEQRADIIDIGGESTRPGVKVREQAAVPANEELRRILPVIEGVLRARSDAIISVDTYKSAVARAALDAGAEIINDVSAGHWDAQMFSTIAAAGCGAVLMHTRGRPEEWRKLPKEPQIVQVVLHDLANAVQSATGAGVARKNMVLDPGFGFGKNFEDNYPLLAHFDQLQQLGLPLMVGTSRKGFIGRTLARKGEDAAPAERLFGTLASITACILKGAHIVRVHDVRAARDAALVADAILSSD